MNSLDCLKKKTLDDISLRRSAHFSFCARSLSATALHINAWHTIYLSAGQHHKADEHINKICGWIFQEKVFKSHSVPVV